MVHGSVHLLPNGLAVYPPFPLSSLTLAILWGPVVQGWSNGAWGIDGGSGELKEKSPNMERSQQAD